MEKNNSTVNIMNKIVCIVFVFIITLTLSSNVYAATSLNSEPNANIELGYSSGVSTGTVRYIQQNTGGYFNSRYWGGWAGSAGIECGTASISMALSYVGINKTPEQILNAHNGITYFSGWGETSFLQPSVAGGMNNFVSGRGKYSPVIIHLPHYSSGGHYVVLVGKVSSNVYQVLDPWNGSVGPIWNITVNGNSVSYYKGTDTIDRVYQYYNASASISEPSMQNNPFGYLDSATGGVAKIHVSGWAADMDAPSKPVAVHFYLVQNGNRKWLGSVTANKYRPDVGAAYPALNNYHGFDATFETDVSGNVQIEAYGINVGSGSNRMLWEAPKSSTIQPDKIPPVISNVRITESSSNGYKVSCTVTDNVKVSRVQFPTWTLYKGQDDLPADWQTGCSSSGRKDGNTYSFYVKRFDHNFEYGTYRTHIYAWDQCGNRTCVIVPDVEVNEVCSHQYQWITDYPSTCLITGKKHQECKICHAHGKVMAIPKIVPTIKLNVNSSLQLQVKKSVTVKVSHLGKGDYVKKWSSSDHRVAVVTSKGKITAGNKIGTTTITVTLASGKKASFKVKTQKKAVETTKLSVNTGKTLELKKGKTFALKCSVAPISSRQKITYKSSNRKIVSVNSKGMIKAIKKGKTTVLITSGRKRVKIVVKVY